MQYKFCANNIITYYIINTKTAKKGHIIVHYYIVGCYYLYAILDSGSGSGSDVELN